MSEDFDLVFEAHYDAIAAYLVRRCASAQDAEDAASEVFAIAWRRLADVPAAPEDRLWLYGVARRVLANQARGQRRRERLLGQLTVLAGRHGLTTSSPTAAGENDTLRALASLSERDRELLMLVGWEGLSVGDAARVLGLPAPTVSRRLHRARQRFRRALVAVAGDDEREPLGAQASLPVPLEGELA